MSLKNSVTYILIALLLSVGTQDVSAKKKLSGRLSLSGAFALYPLAVAWAEEFKKENPDVQIDISAGGAGKGITDVLNNMVEIGMVSREINSSEIAKGAFKIGVAKDAVVPTISSNNPFLKEILAVGITQETAKAIWVDGTFKTYQEAFKTSNKNTPLRIYTRSDACGAAEVWAKYLDNSKKQEDLLGNGVFGDPGLAVAIKNDKLGIGFNNIGYVFDFKTKKPVDGITIIPLDLNNDGKIDKDESFYESIDKLTDAIKSNKFPSPPSRELYFVTKNKPTDPLLVAFLEWVLSDGQRIVKASGFVPIDKKELQLTLDTFVAKQVQKETKEPKEPKQTKENKEPKESKKKGVNNVQK